jgi:hypothetical protein
MRLFSKAFILIVILINFLKLSEVSGLSIVKSVKRMASNDCEDPSESELRTLYIQNLEQHLRDNNILGTRKIPHSRSNKTQYIIHSPMSIANSKKVTDETRCVFSNQTQTEIENNALYSFCPDHIVEIYRNNRYPHILHYSVCNCVTCFNTNETIKDTCRPLYIIQPVLIKTQNQIKADPKKCEWKFELENIPIGCTCMRDQFSDR